MAYIGDNMGQQEILDLLIQNRGNVLDSREIGNALKISSSSISIACKKLRDSKFVKFKLIIEKNRRKLVYWV